MAPLFQSVSLDQSWDERCLDLCRAAVRLKSIGVQDALILLRASFGAPRVQHLLRCAPSAGHLSLKKFDDIQRDALARITNSRLSDTQWLQATLPIREGGLGLRRVESLALPAFLSAAASTSILQDALLMSCPCPLDTFTNQYLLSWTVQYGAMAPEGTFAFKQSSWDKPGIVADKILVTAGLQQPREKAIFLAASVPYSGAWLSALPITSCGLRLDDEAVRVGVALRLGLDVCEAHECRCGSNVDTWGLHAMVCKKAPARSTRHHALNDIIARAITSAWVPVMKEPSGLSRTDGKRPDGLTLVPWQNARPCPGT